MGCDLVPETDESVPERGKIVGRKKKPLPPRVKRMNRQGRLASARSWLPTYSGKNVLKGYCKHFGVDWRCAATELEILGVKLDPLYLASREVSEAEKTRLNRERKDRREAEANAHWHPYTDWYAAYVAGDYAAVYDLEQRQSAVDVNSIDRRVKDS